MMTRPDFMSKQILFLASDNSEILRFKNSNLILVDENNKILVQHSCHKILVVFVYGEFSITSVLIKHAKKFAIPIIFLNYGLKTYHSVIPDNKGNFLLRKKQYDKCHELAIAKHIIRNKVENQSYLMRTLRYKTPEEKLSIEQIELLLDKIRKAENSQALLGIEGTASKLFFETYFKNLDFHGRKPRCKCDIFNLLLDIGYHYLFNFIEANLELYGFDTYCGFYHKFFFQRKSLVCDLIEPFRCIIDRKIKKSFNLKQIDANDFYMKDNQYFIKRKSNKKYSSLFLKEILKYKENIFLYIQSYYRAFVKDKKVENYPSFYLEEQK